jgi:hypothetical protein
MTDAAVSSVSGRGTVKWLILGSSLFLTCLFLLSHPPYTESRDYIGYALLATAWLSFAYFIVAYAARPMKVVFDDGPLRRFAVGALRNRRYLGLSAAFVHTIHFGYVIVFLTANIGDTGLEVLLFAGIAFLALWFMALTSNSWGLRTLGPRWRWLHRFGMHYVWLLYTFTLSGGFGLSLISSLLFALALVAGLLRFAAWWQQRGNAPSSGRA